MVGACAREYREVNMCAAAPQMLPPVLAIVTCAITILSIQHLTYLCNRVLFVVPM